MMKIINKENEMVNIHVAYSNQTNVMKFADELLDSKLVDVLEIRLNHKTKTALIIGVLLEESFNESTIAMVYNNIFHSANQS